MNICFVVTSLNVGGVETYLMRLSEAFTRAGHNVSFLETEKRGEWSNQVSLLGYPVKVITPRLMESSVTHVRRIASALVEEDCIFINHSRSGQASLAFLGGKCLVISVMHLDLPEAWTTVASNPLAFDYLVVINSRFVARALAHKIPEWKIKVIPNGVDIPLGDGRSSSLCRQRGRVTVVYLGRLNVWHKGIDKIPCIFSNLSNIQNSISFTVIGDGPDRKVLGDGLREKCPWLDVEFKGFLPNSEVLSSLPAYDILLMPSNFEGMPMALMEAMGAGVAPVVSNLAGATDCVVANGSSGFLIDPMDINGFSKALKRLVESPSLLKRMSQNAKDTIKERFSSDRMASNYLELITAGRSLKHPSPERSTACLDLLGNSRNLPVGLAKASRYYSKLKNLVNFARDRSLTEPKI